MLCSNIHRGIMSIICSCIEILDRFNYKFNSNLKIRNIVITKLIPNFTCRSIKIYYVIYGMKKEQDFFNIAGSEIIKKLKKRIRKARFPLLKFVYDDKYSNEVFNTINVLKNL